ncbi:hypothetical protein ALC53_01320 [Atta colombica]|uniref:Uncharacterized protein n=1 Tax=Atta colombica TaxID=520822 RepID=A0A195BUJ8_9HYME|nr:hypothetical protein ALC53_01320 [Atta colombica]
MASKKRREKKEERKRRGNQKKMKEPKGGEKKQREYHVDVDVDDCTVIGSPTPLYSLHLTLQSSRNRCHSTRGSYHFNIRPQKRYSEGGNTLLLRVRRITAHPTILPRPQELLKCKLTSVRLTKQSLETPSHGLHCCSSDYYVHSTSCPEISLLQDPIFGM